MMQPGRELDAMIAEKVMGWTLVKGPFGNPVTGRIFDEGWRNQDGNMYFEFPYYSTNIADAWAVVEKLGRWNGFDFLVVLTNPAWLGTGMVWIAGWYELGIGGWEQRCAKEGTTAPHAICLAALDAVNSTTP